MGNYSSTNTEQSTDNYNLPNENKVVDDNKLDQESGVINPPPLYVVYNINTKDVTKYYYTYSLEKATEYVDELIYADISANLGTHIRTEEEETDDEIIYTLYKQDLTSLFCKYSFYHKYRILKIESLPSVANHNKSE